jgi:abequosyltransferase
MIIHFQTIYKNVYSVVSLLMEVRSLIAGKTTVFDVSVAIPAYCRSSELVELLRSIYGQSVMPAEVTICEDMSPEREAIRSIADAWRERFASKGCILNYQENERNLGYDGNVRRIIHASHSTWVLLIGNDDLLLPGCIEAIAAYTAAYPEQRMMSRSFLMFKSTIQNELGFAQLYPKDHLFTPQNSEAGIIMRAFGFVGGIVIHRTWAEAIATEQYDGSLYYQIYLGAVAYCQLGIGYISGRIVGSRAGNPPLFGAASSEQDVHIPGSYTPKGRSRMWANLIRICDEVGTHYGVDLTPQMKKELEVRQSFHIFEMMAGSSPKLMRELKNEFTELGLFGHPLPRVLYTVNIVLRGYAPRFYWSVRKLRNWLYSLRYGHAAA